MIRVLESESNRALGYWGITISEYSSLRVLEPPSLDVVESQGVWDLWCLKELRGTSRN